MIKELKVIASVMLITVATASQLRAAAAVNTNTYTNLVRNIQIALTVYEQGPTNGPKNGDKITIEQKKLTTATVLNDLAAATGTNFGTTPKLVRILNYYATNLWEFAATITNTSATSTNGIATNVYVEVGNTNQGITVQTTYMTATATNITGVTAPLTIFYPTGITSSVESVTNSNVSGVTSVATLQFVGILSNYFTNNPATIAVMAGGRGASAEPFTDVSSFFGPGSDPIVYASAIELLNVAPSLTSGTGTNLLSTNNPHFTTENTLSINSFGATISLVTNLSAVTESDLTTATNNLTLSVSGLEKQTLAFETELNKTNKVQSFNSSWFVTGGAYVGGSTVLTTNNQFYTNVPNGVTSYSSFVGTNAANQNVFKYVTNYVPAIVQGTITETFLENKGE